ncbi:hypothetical protein B0A49_05046 [Cryomyces minteri]|uniref:Endoplasmic reticulum junction formation protein lunapark n=1 Tax=Cryomyces minteri TaxID=331657 RepID=A0A4U0WX81_9PEZI|nr:hypothetical protein B0A49_05046 [Cryomyces minteri]
MVSFWPWKGDATSAASFEKILASLATKIAKTTAKNDGFRQRQRRYKVLWTLYTSFAYTVSAIILTLVTGWQKWGPVEYTAIAGGPLLIYAVRAALTAYYNYRIAGTQAHLDNLLKQREAAIEKLKAATKYNSTQQLLEKYGGSPQSAPKPAPSFGGKSRSSRGVSQGGRTNIAPPPTANIPQNKPLPATPQQPVFDSPPRGQMATTSLSSSAPQAELTLSAEFAPNAYTAPPQYASESRFGQPRWYDRILDVLLGEDETQPKNRIVLICSNCKLVNGQAPPGTKSLADIGRWRCAGCKAMNGEENETHQIMEQISRQAGGRGSVVPQSSISNSGEDTNRGQQVKLEEVEDDDAQSSDRAMNDDEESEEEATSEPPSASTRSKAGRGKKRT